MTTPLSCHFFRGKIMTNTNTNTNTNLMMNKRVLVRTDTAGVHMGIINWINPNDPKNIILFKAKRLWSWEGGGLSLSAIAKNGVVKARINETHGMINLNGVIECLETTDIAEATFLKFIED